jgi:acyl carrier protein
MLWNPSVNALELTRKLIRACLQLQDSAQLPIDTPLLGGFSDFNSLTITGLVLGIEEALDCEIAGDELSGDIFESIGSLASFVDAKMALA